MVAIRHLLGCSIAALALSACAATTTDTGMQPQTTQTVQMDEDAMVADLLSRMSVESKVAQIVQPDIGSITPADVGRYRFGTVLNGGNSGPNGNDLAPAPEWLALADAFWDASTAPRSDGEPVIPTLWASDAVHGHSNIVGATIFPHNIGLGATRDGDLIRRIGEVTAAEIRVTGIDWTFAPTVAVARDDRWGRTYESYSEDPQIVADLAPHMVTGLQGPKLSEDYLSETRVIATAKHYFGDGGTTQGVDQGDVNGDIEELIALHAAPYPAVIDAGIESVMASFNSINGTKMHGNKELLDDYLRGPLGFDGVVVGDWNGHGQVAGCTNSDCPQALMAGLDIYMVPEDWKALYETLVAQVKDGTIPMARLDEAAGRVLKLKMRAGVMGENARRPSERMMAGDWSMLGSADHRAVAREAVAKSLVLLKNDGNVLPLKAGQTIHVAGAAADSVAQAAGGWSLTWQGGGELTNADFPGATSIFAGIRDAAAASGATATLDVTGSAAARPDVAVVVFGEPPYAEFVGDRKDLAFRDEEGLELLKAYRAKGVKTVAVFLSGRPLWMNREMNAADAFVAAWLPGTEGGGVADVLYGQRPVTGKLSFSWPASCGGAPVNGADGALFTVGYGLTYGQGGGAGGMLSEECAVLSESNGSVVLFDSGALGNGSSVWAAGSGGWGNANALVGFRGGVAGVTVTGLDRDTQEDARRIAFAGPGGLEFRGPPTGDGAIGYRIAYKIDALSDTQVTLGTDCAGATCTSTSDATMGLRNSAQKGWREMVVTDECLDGLSESGTLRMSFSSAFTIDVDRVERFAGAEGISCSF